MQALDDLIGPALGSSIFEAINVAGQIVGFGSLNGGYNQAVLLTPVAADRRLPAALPLLAGGLGRLALLGRRRRG